MNKNFSAINKYLLKIKLLILLQTVLCRKIIK